MPKRPAIIILLLLAFAVVAVLTRMGPGDKGDVKDIARTPVIHEKAPVETDVAGKPGTKTLDRGQAGEGEGADPDGSRNPSVLKRAIKDFLETSETSRSRTLTEVRSGPSMIYLLAVDPPSSEQIASARLRIAEIQDAVGKWAEADKGRTKEREDFDKWLGKQIVKYDPFGTSHNKAIAITIHDDPSKPMVGFTFTTQSYDEEITRFSNGTTDFEFENFMSYGRDDGGILERFRKLIVQD